ncbi:MAG: cysteine desulfurase [Clostridiales Family XIII bacterium]|nr:cysteine desulfurase [Clostridiales Family XIII bacterium]
MVYLDNSATTPPYKKTIETMASVMEEDYANPSALHDGGLAAEKRVKTARESLAAVFGARGEGRVVFTSGGTESDNMALICGARAKRRQGDRIIISAMEHPAVLETCKYLENEGFRVSFMEADPSGRVLPDSLADCLGEDVILVSCMHVNNETGAIQPLPELIAVKRAFENKTGKSILFHVDAVQSFCKLPPPPGADMVSLSAHKLHGPRGVGALFLRDGVRLPPLIFGGGQEGGLRSGTENVPGIAAFAVAAEMASARLEERYRHVTALKEALLSGIMSEIGDVRLNGPELSEFSSPYILNLSFLGIKGEALLHALEQRGVLVSTGAACSSRKKSHSHVLKAMGLSDKEAEGAIRFSFSEFNTLDEIYLTVAATKEAVDRFRRVGRFR